MVDLKKKNRLPKSEICSLVAQDVNLSENVVSTVFNSALSVISNHLKKGISVSLMDFGSFRVQKIKPRKGRNIRTGEAVDIPARKRIKFTPAKKLSDAVSKRKK